MSNISGIECNACKQQAIEHSLTGSKGWVSVSERGRPWGSGLFSTPDTHLCPECWAKAKAAVIPEQEKA